MKNKLLEKSLANLVILLIIYFAILVGTGLFVADTIIYYFPEELKSSATISGFVSLTVSSLISILIIGLIIGTIFFINYILDFKIHDAHIIQSFYYVVVVFIIFELAKFLISLLILEEELINITFTDRFLEDLRNTDWFFFNILLNYLMIFLASIVYVHDLYINKNVKKISSLIVIFIMLTFGFYISLMDSSSIT